MSETVVCRPVRPDHSQARRPWRLSGRSRKAVLVLHIASAGAWLGLDVAMAVLIATAATTTDPSTKQAVFPALELVAIWPMLAAGLTCLLTGLVLGLGSKYGLVRYWWVAVKLALNLVLSVLVLIALAPGLRADADQVSRLSPPDVLAFPVGDLAFPPIVSPSALILATVLSVFKPWGLIRRRRADATASARAVDGASRGSGPSGA
jgi:hypothetical protein